MAEQNVRIERAANGYEVELRDPEIIKKNNNDSGPWRDPTVSYVFTEIDEMLDFLKNNLEQALTSLDDGYDSAFVKALKE